MQFSYYRTLLLSLLALVLLSSCAKSESQRRKLRRISEGPSVDSAVISSQPAAPEPLHLRIATSYAGTREVGENHGPAVERFLSSVHLNAGNPYCAAFVSFCLDSASTVKSISRPGVRSALAHNFITKRSIPARKVIRGTVAVPDGTILIWQKGTTIYGHIGFVIRQKAKNKFQTIEANTTAGPYGNQRDGEGVWERERSIQPGNYFRITNFTLVTYEQ